MKHIKADLAFIKSNFACIPVTITKLEEQGVLLSEAIANFESVKEHLKKVPRRKEFAEKYDKIYEKNKGLQTLAMIAKILEGDLEADHEYNEYIKALTPNELNTFKNAPIVSCDVERSFSAYNRILED